MRLYTRAGDRGTTTLIGGRKVSKASARVSVFGTIDELNSAIGVALAFLGDRKAAPILLRIQDELFTLGAELASPEPGRGIPTVSAKHVAALEKDIARFEKEFEGRKFVLPSGVKSAAFLHLARTIARRAERKAVALSEAEPINPETVRYLNRLSTLLFILAIHENRFAKVAERHPTYSPG